MDLIVVVVEPTGGASGEVVAAWAQALLSAATLAISGAVAVITWTAQVRRSAESSLAPIRIAERVSTQFHQSLERLDDLLDSGTLGYWQAQRHLQDGVFSELIHIVDELKITDFPTAKSAEAYRLLRSAIRGVSAELDAVASRRDSRIRFSCERFQTLNGRAWAELKAEEEAFLHPLTPKWWKIMRKQRRRRKLSQDIAERVAAGS